MTPDFLTYFLSHIPTSEQWVAFLLVNLVAYVAATNAVVRRQRRQEAKAHAQQLEQLERQRRLAIQCQFEQQQLLKEHWAMIQKQSRQIEALENQLQGARQLHLN